MPSTLESTFATLIARATAEIAAAVRDNIAGEVLRAATSQTRSAPPPPAPPAADRKPTLASTPSPQAVQARGAGDDTERVLRVIAGHAGIRTEKIYAIVGLPVATVKKALARLRASGAVRTSGEKRGTTYHAASAPVAAAPAAAPVAKAGRVGRLPGASHNAASPMDAPKPPSAKVPSKVSSNVSMKGAKRSSAQVAADDAGLLAYVRANPGQRSEQIQKGVGMRKQNVASGLGRLREAGKVKMAGVKRAATYVAR